MRKYLAKKRAFLEFLEMDAEQRRRKAEGLVVSKEIMEVLSEVFHGETLDIITLPKPEELTDEYFDRMYPKTQREEDTRRGLISFRSRWWEADALPSVVGPNKETWEQAYIRSMKAEAVHFQGKVILTESIQKPQNAEDGSRQYGTEEGRDATKDPLLPIIREVFFDEKANRFNLSWDQISRLRPKVKKKIKEAFEERRLPIPKFDVIITPALASNIQMTQIRPENSRTKIYEWTSTRTIKQNGGDSGDRLLVGCLVDGGAGQIESVFHKENFKLVGFRLSVVF